MKELQDLCKSLESKIQDAYSNGTTLEEAERLASEFLFAQIQVSQALQQLDLDSRMRKSGTKAIRAAVYTAACSSSEKKPTESALEHMLNLNEMVQDEQERLDSSESERDNLERYFNIFRDAHIHYRGVSRGKFE